MNKLESIKADLAKLDSFLLPNAERTALILRVASLEKERERIDSELRATVKALDALALLDGPAKKEAGAFAMEVTTKYGKSIGELRAILAMTS